MFDLLNKLTRELKLKIPVEIRVKTRKNRYCDAMYWPRYNENCDRLACHVITIYTVEVSRSFEALLAHELLHAWQEENNYEETHGPRFRRKAKHLEAKYGLNEIFLPDIDDE